MYDFDIHSSIMSMSSVNVCFYLRLPSMTEKPGAVYKILTFTQVNFSETRKLHREFPLSLGRGKKYDPWSLKVKNSQCYCHFTKTKLAPN